jgi:hypothetical protein
MKEGDTIICKSQFDKIKVDDVLTIKDIYIDGSIRIRNEVYSYTIIRYAFHEHFLLLSEWREDQIKSILED